MIINLPKSLKIGPTRFHIKVSPEYDVAGRILYRKSEVHIDGDLHDQGAAETLLHEMLHGILDSVGHTEMNKDEGFVVRLGESLMGSLLESPGLLEYLISVRDSVRSEFK